MSNLHPIFKQILSPYTGTMITDLIDLSARVDNALDLSSSVNSRDPRRILSAAFRHLGNWEALVTLRTHLADIMLDQNGKLRELCLVEFWWELGDLQDCLAEGSTRLCRNCGEMEGMHQLRRYCRNQRVFENLSNVLSYTFEAR